MVAEKFLPRVNVRNYLYFLSRQQKNCLDSRYYLQIQHCRSNPTSESPSCFPTGSQEIRR